MPLNARLGPRFRPRLPALALACLGLLMCPGRAPAEDVFLPAENIPVRLKEFSGYTLIRRGQEIVVAHNGKRLRTMECDAGVDNAGKPHALAHDLDGDGVPELFILQAATETDSVYSLVHFKHGVGQRNYLFEQWPNSFFADPLFEPKTRTLTERTSAGYSRAYVWKKPVRSDEAQYQWTHETFPEVPLSPREQERVAFLDADGRLPKGLRPLLPADLPRSFMPGALPIDALSLARRRKSWHSGPLRKGTQVAFARTTPDGRWAHVWGGDDTRQGWVPVKALFVETREPVTLADMPSTLTELGGLGVDATPPGCPASLPAGAQLLLLRAEKNEDGSFLADVRTSCGRTGRMDYRLLRSPKE